MKTGAHAHCAVLQPSLPPSLSKISSDENFSINPLLFTAAITIYIYLWRYSDANSIAIPSCFNEAITKIYVSTKILWCGLKNPWILLYCCRHYLLVSTKILWYKLEHHPIIIYHSHYCLPVCFQIPWCILERLPITSWRRFKYLKERILLLHIDFILNTNLAYLHLLKDVIPLLHLTIYWNYLTGVSHLDYKRYFRENIFFSGFLIIKGLMFSVETARSPPWNTQFNWHIKCFLHTNKLYYIYIYVCSKNGSMFWVLWSQVTYHDILWHTPLGVHMLGYPPPSSPCLPTPTKCLSYGVEEGGVLDRDQCVIPWCITHRERGG